MLRKKAKDLDSEYKQLQLEYQEKENRMIALENEVEVKDAVRRSVQLHTALNRCDVLDVCGSYFCVHVMTHVDPVAWCLWCSVRGSFFDWCGWKFLCRMLILCYSLLRNPALLSTSIRYVLDAGYCFVSRSLRDQHLTSSNQQEPAWTTMQFMLDCAGFFSRVSFFSFLFWSLFLVPCPV